MRHQCKLIQIHLQTYHEVGGKIGVDVAGIFLGSGVELQSAGKFRLNLTYSGGKQTKNTHFIDC